MTGLGFMPRRLWGVCLTAAMLMVGALTGIASAAPVLDAQLVRAPTNFVPGGIGEYSVEIRNYGDVASADPLQVDIALPAGVQTRLRNFLNFSPFLEATVGADLFPATFSANWSCPTASTPGETAVSCTYSGGVQPGGGRPPRLTVYVDVAPGASGVGTAMTRVSVGGETLAGDTVETPFTNVSAPFGIEPGSFVADVFDRSGKPERQAGAHPHRAQVAFNFTTAQQISDPDVVLEPQGRFNAISEQVRNVDVELPRGFIGDPQAVPRCPQALLPQQTGAGGNGTRCPASTQVGYVDVEFEVTSGSDFNRFPVYNMEPAEGVVADFGFAVVGVPAHIIAELDPTDYTVVTRVTHINEFYPIRRQLLTLWGVPADPAHDRDRWDPDAPGLGYTGEFGARANQTRRAFLTLPSECGVEGKTSLHVDSWEGSSDPAPGAPWHDSEPAVARGCEKQQFKASLSAMPNTTQADAPTGLTVNLDIEQNLNPVGLGTPPLRKAVVRLPDGVSVSPTSADGLGGCSPEEIGLGTNNPVRCPDSSKVGTVKITTPLLPDPLDGSVYLGQQGNNPFRSLLSLYIAARGPGVLIKLPGKVEPTDSNDWTTAGNLTATFDNNPQLPFSNLELRFKGGDRGTLAVSLTCGEKTTTAELTSWNAAIPPVVSTSRFTVSEDGNGRPCPPTPRFEPGFNAGMVNPGGGQDSTFTLTMTRPDRNMYFNDIAVQMPTGLLGRIAKVPLCSNAAANTGSCGEESRVGQATVGAGPGPTPFWLGGGRVYLTEGYKGGDYGLAIAMRVLAGPFDLGTVVVRQSIHVDRTTAAISIKSDPIPWILQGIPLRIRTINVDIDKQGFLFNPTDCRPKSIDATISSIIGQVVGRSSRFQAGGCSSLPFRPRMTLQVGGRGRTRRDLTTPLKVTLDMGPGQANNRAVQVTLPKTINARLRVVQRACTLAEFHSNRCTLRVGTGTAITPLLREPLTGPAYFVRNPARRLPDLMVALRGPVDIDLTGKVTIPRDLTLRTNFDAVPDAPITKFTLSLIAGRNGTVGAVENLCTARARRASIARLSFRAHSGRLVQRDQKLKIAGCGRASGRDRAGRRGGRAGRGRRSRRAGRGRRVARSRRARS